MALKLNLTPDETLCFISTVYINASKNSTKTWQYDTALSLCDYFDEQYLFGAESFKDDVYSAYKDELLTTQ